MAVRHSPDSARDPDIKPERYLTRIAELVKASTGTGCSSISIIEEERHQYSTTWRLRCGDNLECILKSSGLRTEREVEMFRLCQRVFGTDPFVRVPRIVEQIAPGLLLTERIPGVPLTKVMARPSPLRFRHWLSRQGDFFAELGRSLKLFHEATHRMESPGTAGLRHYVRNREAVFPLLGGGVVDRLLRLVDRDPPPSSVRAHGDFSPHNILVHDGRAGIIDFAGVREFDSITPAVDLAWMAADLEYYWRQPLRNPYRFFQGPVKQCVRRFLNGYDSPLWDREMFRTCCAVRHFCRLYSLYRRGVEGGGAWRRAERSLRGLLD